MDREFAAAAIHQDGEGDASRAAEVRQFIHGRANRASGVEHIVHDHDVPTIEAQRQARLPDDGPRANRLQVIAVQRDVERASGDAYSFAFIDEGGDTLGELNATALDADQDQVIRSRKKLDYLIGHASQRASHGPRVEHNGRFSGLRALAHRGAQYRHARKGFVPVLARCFGSHRPWAVRALWQSAPFGSQRPSAVRGVWQSALFVVLSPPDSGTAQTAWDAISASPSG